MIKKAFSWCKDNKLLVGLCAAFLSVGIITGLGINYRYDFALRFDEKINPTELLQVFVGVILVWLVASSLNKQQQTERNSKDIVQRRVRELHDYVDGFADHDFGSNYKYTNATTGLRRIETGILSIEKLIIATELNFPENLLQKLSTTSSELDDLLTNIPVQDTTSTTVPELQVTNGICTFGGDRLAEINATFDNLKDALLELEIMINVCPLGVQSNVTE